MAKTHWNHRLVELQDGDDTILMLCEVFYEDDKPVMRNEGARVSGQTLEEVRKVLDQFAGALLHPVLKGSDLGPQGHEPSA